MSLKKEKKKSLGMLRHDIATKKSTLGMFRQKMYCMLFIGQLN